MLFLFKVWQDSSRRRVNTIDGTSGNNLTIQWYGGEDMQALSDTHLINIRIG